MTYHLKLPDAITFSALAFDHSQSFCLEVEGIPRDGNSHFFGGQFVDGTLVLIVRLPVAPCRGHSPSGGFLSQLHR